MALRSTLAIAGAFATGALAHGTVTGFRVDGEYHGGYLLDYYYLKQNGGEPPKIASWSAENLDNGFISPDAYDTVDINCHKNAAAGATSVSVRAGGTVDFMWSEWPESHIGPVFTYVAKCAGECSAAEPGSLKWVKIDEAGINLDTQVWAATDLINNNNTWTTTVPSTLASGNYVFRHEIIAMHGAGEENGAQNYPQCINIEITGGGSDEPEGVLGTALYSSTDAGIKFNPYTELTSYEIPGPALYGSGGNQPISTPTSGNGDSSPDPTPMPTPPSTIVTSVTPGFPTTSAAVPSVVTGVAEEPESTAAAAPTNAPIDDSTTAPEDGSSTELPETFTLDTFITWLKSVGGSAKTRRHARALY